MLLATTLQKKEIVTQRKGGSRNTLESPTWEATRQEFRETIRGCCLVYLALLTTKDPEWEILLCNNFFLKQQSALTLYFGLGYSQVFWDSGYTS